MIQFDLVSPEKKIFSAPVAMVTLPGTEGDFGVLPGHAPFISTMRVGIIDVYDTQSTVFRRMLVTGGLVEVNTTSCTVLAEEATPLEEISIETLGEKHTQLTERYAVAEGESRDALKEAIEISEKKLEIMHSLRH